MCCRLQVRAVTAGQGAWGDDQEGGGEGSRSARSAQSSGRGGGLGGSVRSRSAAGRLGQRTWQPRRLRTPQAQTGGASSVDERRVLEPCA